MNTMPAIAFFAATVLLITGPLPMAAALELSSPAPGFVHKSLADPFPKTAMQLSSPAFKDRGPIPGDYARALAGGSNVSIPLKWTGAPKGTKSFALSIVDHHPIARRWAHWIVINIPPEVSSLPEGASGKNMPPGAIEIRNSFGEVGYGGPQPPKGTGPHRYVITIYALKDASLDLKPNATLADFQNTIKGKTLDEASITGLFEQ
jgi:Raf kinase inhibitor-like YbhB/YbcL family protein